MNKRPLCAACILLMLLIVLGGLLGMDYCPRPPTAQLKECLEEQKAGEIRGRIADYHEKENSIQYILKNTVLSASGQHIPLQTILVYTEKENKFHIGDDVYLSGEIEEIEAPSNPGMFDARIYYGVQGICCRCFADTIAAEKGGKAPTWAEQAKQYMRSLRYRAADNLSRAAGKYAGILQAMALGEKNELDARTKSSFQQGGVLHILTISGLHITLIGMGILKILMRTGCPLKIAAPGALAVLLLYSIFIGMGSSCIRAVLMFCAALGAKILLRTYDLPSALSLAAILMLLENPAYLYYSGFQLSFGAVACAGILVPSWERTGEKTILPSVLCKKVLRAVRSGFWMWLFLSPLCAYHFYETAVVGIIMNILIIPMLPVLLVSGLAAAGVGFISMQAACAAAFPGVLILRIMEAFLALGRKLPGSVWITGQPEKWRIFLAYAGVLLLLVLRKKLLKLERKSVLLCAVNAAAAMWVILLLIPYAPKKLTLTMVDVGQGDCFVVRTKEGINLMIDGGSTTENDVGYYRILPYLKSQGIAELDGVFLTHPDADHMNGIIELAEMISTDQTAFSIKTLYLPEWMQKTDNEELFTPIRTAAIKVQYVHKGMELKTGSLKISVLHPDGADYSNDTNAGSTTLLMEYGKFTALFTGDLEGEGEHLVEEQLVPCDLLKVAHHGSRSSTSMEFLRKIRPSICFLSYGENNPYGHPHPELIKRLKDSQAHVYQTAKDGAVTLMTDGQTAVVKKYLTGVEE